jgi:LysM repeat protein
MIDFMNLNVYNNTLRFGKKTILLVFVYFYLSSFIFHLPLYSDFKYIGVGARQQGMGNAFTGIGNDVTSVYYNPGALGFVTRGECIVDYNQLYSGLDDGSNITNSFIGAVYPIIIRKVKDRKWVPVSRGTAGVGILTFGLNGVYQENSVYLSYGKVVFNRLSVGGSMKFLTESYVQDSYTRADRVFEYGNKGAVQTVSFDAGVLYNFVPRVYLGAAMLNINQPNIGLKTNESLPLITKLGVGYIEKGKTVVGVDLVLEGKDNSFNLGIEQWFLKSQVCGRVGMEIGTREYKKFSLGASYTNKKTFQIDYSMSLPLGTIKDTMGTSKISLVYKFGRVPENELEPGSLEEAFDKLEREAKQLKEDYEKSKVEIDKLEKALIEDAVAKTKERIKVLKVEPQEEKAVQRESRAVSTVVTHTVKDGDTLQSLAGKYYNNLNKWLDIYNANKDKIGHGGSLTIGQVLVIPQESGTQPAVKQVTEPGSASPDKPKESGISEQKTHVVKEGETLPAIAQKYYGNAQKWMDIYKANKDKIPRGKVEPGQVLVIP